MGRYRPPSPPKSAYITPQGMAKLRDEEKTIWERRRDVVAALSAAAAEGDRSENAEYIYRKKELAGLDRRIRYLQKRLPQLNVVDLFPDNQEQVFFGAWVELEDERGATVKYRIVGPDEFDQSTQYISMDSPLARALIKKYLDDEVEVRTPAGTQIYIIVDIEYQQP